MKSKNYSDIILSKYFLELSKKNVSIPYMTTISTETGISNSTISRYAKRKGFYNFGELRASFNKSLGGKIINYESEEMEKIFNHHNVKIVSSVSTKIIGLFIKGRLEFLGSNIEIVNEDTKWDGDEVTVFTTITSESYKLRKFIEKAPGDKIIITTSEIEKLPKSCKQIILSDYSIDSYNSYDICNSIVKIINWLNESINLLQIKWHNESNS